jgi:hypothetical protein
MTLYKWSQTASADATADSTINWAEGQAPSSVNDSARAMMAATAKYRDDIAGAIVTTGTSTAYAVSSYQAFDTLSHLNGQIIAFTPHTTNGATVTLHVDSLGAKPLRTAPNTELLAGVLIQGTPYIAVYNNGDAAFYLGGFFGNPYNIPLGAGLDYWGSATPNSSFAFPTGQAISRATYASLFSLIGTTYGTGDGSTTFNLPDKTGDRIDARPQRGLFLSRRRDEKPLRPRPAIAPAAGDGMESASQGLVSHRIRYHRQPRLRQQLHQSWLSVLPARLSMGVAQYAVLAKIPRELTRCLLGGIVLVKLLNGLSARWPNGRWAFFVFQRCSAKLRTSGTCGPVEIDRKIAL